MNHNTNNPFSNRVNRRQNPQSRHLHYNRNMNTHFDNIQILANIIQDSQRLLENQNNNGYSTMNSFISRSNFVSPNTEDSREPFNTRNTFNNTNPFTNTNLFMNTNPSNLVLYFDTLFPGLGIHSSYTDNSHNTFIHKAIDSSNINLINDLSSNDLSNSDIYNVSYQLIENPMNEICPITRESFYLNQTVSMICNCKHIFNKEALNIWIENNNSCPSCRGSIRRLTQSM